MYYMWQTSRAMSNTTDRIDMSLLVNNKSNRSENTTSDDDSADSEYDQLFEALMFIDKLTRCYGVLVFLVFFGVFLNSSKMKTRTLFYVNHCTLTSSFLILMMFCYINNGGQPTFANATLNDVLCSMSEILWIFAIYIRMYSVLLIAIYRYLAVFHMRLFNRLNASWPHLLGPVVCVWLFSIACPVATKFAFRTRYSAVLCLDGFTTDVGDLVLYCVVNFSLMIALPALSSVAIYMIIVHKLHDINRKLKRSIARNKRSNGVDNTSSGRCKKSATEPNLLAKALKLSVPPRATDCAGAENASSAGRVDLMSSAATSVVASFRLASQSISVVETEHRVTSTSAGETSRRLVIIRQKRQTRTSIKIKKLALNNRRHQRLANQFFFMCCSVLACSFVHLAHSLRMLLPDYYETFYYWRPLLRSYLVVAITMIPLITLYFHPHRKGL